MLSERADHCHVLYLQAIASADADPAKALAAAQTELAAKDAALEKKQRECSSLKGRLSASRMEQSASEVPPPDVTACILVLLLPHLLLSNVQDHEQALPDIAPDILARSGSIPRCTSAIEAC